MNGPTEYMLGAKSTLAHALDEVKSLRNSFHRNQNSIKSVSVAENTEICKEIGKYDCLNMLKVNNSILQSSAVRIVNIKGLVDRKNQTILKLNSELRNSMGIRIKRENKLEQKLNEVREIKTKNSELMKVLYASENIVKDLKIALDKERMQDEKLEAKLQEQSSKVEENEMLLNQLSQLRKCLHEKDRSIMDLRQRNVQSDSYFDVGGNSLRQCRRCEQYRFDLDESVQHCRKLIDECDYYKKYIYDWQNQCYYDDNMCNESLNRNSDTNLVDSDANPPQSNDTDHQTLNNENQTHDHVTSQQSLYKDHVPGSSGKSTPLYPITEENNETEEKNVNNYIALGSNADAPQVDTTKIVAQQDDVSVQASVPLSHTQSQPVQQPARSNTQTPTKTHSIRYKKNTIIKSPLHGSNRAQNNHKKLYIFESKVHSNQDILHGNTHDVIPQGVVWHPELLNKLTEEENLSSESGTSDSYLHSKVKSKRRSKNRKSGVNVENKGTLGQFVKYKGHDIDVTNFSMHNFREVLWALECDPLYQLETTSTDFLKFLALLAKKLNDDPKWAEKHSLGQPKDWLALKGCV